MIQTGTIKLQRVSIEHLSRENNKYPPMAISDRGPKIVPIVGVDKTNNIISALHDNGETTELDLNSLGICWGTDLSYLRIDYFSPKETIIAQSAWQFIIDNGLINSKIEFDDSEEMITTFTYYEKPKNAELTQVYKIKFILFQSHFSGGQVSGYMTEDYATPEEAQKALPEIAHTPYMDIQNERQLYFVIEEVYKRKEYEKKIYKS